MRFSCTTLFDITVTGITGHYKPARVPFLDRANNRIEDQAAWTRARNQQRNWETINQIIGLRTQITDSTLPSRSGLSWTFEFETETPGVYGTDDDPVSILLRDAQGVPMIVDLDNRSDLPAMMIVSGPSQNIWFAPAELNIS